VVPWQVMRDDVRYLETLDIGTVWLGDRYLMPSEFGGSVLEAWTTLAALATCTSRVRLGTMVSDVSLRHPAMLAKQAATVDCISGGRLDLGIGPGDNIPEEIASLGLPSLPSDARIDRLREGVEVIDRLLRGRQVTYQGEYYHVQARNQLLNEYCAAADRDPGTIERACFVGWSDCESPFVSRAAFQDFVGRYRDAGIQRFVFSFGSAETPAPYSKWVASGAWVNRAGLEAFAAQEIKDLQGPDR
jgi:hypothetical protein